MNKKINAIICLDFETGGLDYRKNPITQIGIVSFTPNDFQVITSYKTEVKPYDDLEVEDRALELTGLTMQKINEGKDIKVALEEMLEVFKKSNVNEARNSKPILLGQNLSFDMDFLMKICEDNKVDLSKYLVTDKNGRPFYFDTMFMAKMIWANEEDISFKLSDLLERAGLEAHDAHDALNDVYATKELFQFLITSGRNTESDIEKEARFRTTFEF